MNGFWKRLIVAFRCLFSILFHGEIPNDIAQLMVEAESPIRQAPAVAISSSRVKEVERPAAEGFDRAVQMLAVLQRDGRLIDFLAENISAYPDAQLGGSCPNNSRNVPEGPRPLCEAGTDPELRRGSTGDGASGF